MKGRIVLAIGILAVAPIPAGTLDPPLGPPAPTMVTLQQIYDKQSGPLARTGQTGCWDGLGNSMSCSPPTSDFCYGQDATLKKGAAVSPRFASNPDGTVKDNLTGLIWLTNANCFGDQDWASAIASTQTLASGACGLTDGSTAGAWRLPNLNELLSLVDWGQTTSLPPGHPFLNVRPGYWSSTPYNSSQFVWIYRPLLQQTTNASRQSFLTAWPVRGGR